VRGEWQDRLVVDSLQITGRSWRSRIRVVPELPPLGAYLEDVVSRHHGRRVSGTELALALADMPNDDLAEPPGVLLIAKLNTRDVGCGGIRLLKGGSGK
jgi:hypothetical protein